jgi:ribosomal protein S18 acetylase RimI-like enzyme
MEDSRVALRPAKPEFEEGLLFARYLDAAADGVFRFMLGKAADRVLAKAFLEPAHDLSYGHVTFAERDTTIIGMVSSYSSQQHRRSSDGPLIRAAGWRAARMAAVGVIAAGLFRFLGTVPEGDFYLQAVAADPQSRGGGVGSALIRHAEERGRRAGCTRLALDVAVDNHGARQLYERLGFVVEAASPRSAILPKGQVHRMAAML